MEEKINEIKQKSTVALVPPLPPPLKTITESPVAGKEKEKEKEKELLLEKKKNSPPVVVTADYKGHIKNITKLRESVKLDLKKLKKQDELLQRLEKQQLEHSKLLKEQREIINELKSHDKIFHEDDKKEAKEAKEKEGNLTVEKQHKLDSGKLASSPPAAAAVAAAVKPEMPVKRSLISNGNVSSEALAAAAAAPPLPPNPSPVIASYAQSKAVIASNISNQKVEPVINKEVAQLKAEAKPPLNTIVQSPGPSKNSLSDASPLTEKMAAAGAASSPKVGAQSNQQSVQQSAAAAVPVGGSAPNQKTAAAAVAAVNSSSTEKVVDRSKDRDI